MRRVLPHLLTTLCLALAVSAGAAAQNAGGASAKVPPGTYTLVPDTGYAGPDVSAFTVQFIGDTLLIVKQAGLMVVRSTLKYEGPVMLWTDLEGEMMCPEPARYSVTVGKDFVRVTPVVDSCEGRATVTSGVRMVRQS